LLRNQFSFQEQTCSIWWKNQRCQLSLTTENELIVKIFEMLYRFIREINTAKPTVCNWANSLKIMRSLIYQICLILILKKRNRNVWQIKSSNKKKKLVLKHSCKIFLNLWWWNQTKIEEKLISNDFCKLIIFMSKMAFDEKLFNWITMRWL